MPDLPTAAPNLYAATINGTTLTADLDIGERSRLDASDTTKAQRKGGLVLVDSELIYYAMYDESEPGVVYDLMRGMNGTTEADHDVATAVVTFFSYEMNLLSMQAHILNLEQRLQDLEP